MAKTEYRIGIHVKVLEFSKRDIRCSQFSRVIFEFQKLRACYRLLRSILIVHHLDQWAWGPAFMGISLGQNLSRQQREVASNFFCVNQWWCANWPLSWFMIHSDSPKFDSIQLIYDELQKGIQLTIQISGEQHRRFNLQFNSPMIAYPRFNAIQQKTRLNSFMMCST